MPKIGYIIALLAVSLAASCQGYRNNYKNVEDILPQSLAEPRQTELSGPQRVYGCERDGSYWEYEPVHGYEIAGLVFGTSHKFLSWYNGAIPADLGILWGENASHRHYKDVKLRVMLSHSTAAWGDGVRFNMSQMSNTHFATCEPAVSKKLRSVLTGDQVLIKGKLVNARVMPERGETRPEKIGIWTTSTTRNDTGEGACEIVYVERPEDITVLKRGPLFWEIAYQISLWGLVLACLTGAASHQLRLRRLLSGRT